MSSKIKVDTIENVAGSGNVSLGSGHNLVVPGNITGQGTTTLTGDLTVDTSLLKVDSTNNRIGIGTASPTQATLHVAGGGVPARFESTSSATTYVQFGASGTSNYGQIAMNGNDMTLRTAYTDRMKIDGSGRISMPSVPRFLARRNQSSWTVSANTIMVWDTATPGTYNGYNIGSHYNTSNGKFTCPVAGTYYFEATSIVNTQVTNAAWYFRKNGSAIHEQHITQGSNGWTAHHIAYTGEFAANDTMEVFNGSPQLGYYGNAWSYFHGRMIG